MNKKVIVFDIDGVLAEPGKRLIHIKKKPEDWDSFYQDVESDKPIQSGCSIAKYILKNKKSDNDIIFLTGRPEKCREGTIKWLQEYISKDIISEQLIMRENWNYVPDVCFKRKAAEEIGFKNVESVFEDKEIIINMWAENGVDCFRMRHGIRNKEW